MSEKVPKHLLNLIAEGKKISTEFKESQKSLPDSLFETICAFLNRNGGHIFLGVKNNGSIVGVSDKHIETMKKDFANLCNNPQKINPTVYLKLNEYEINKLKILHIYVHESSDVHKTKNKIFDRNEDGDYNITQNTILVANMYLSLDRYDDRDDIRTNLIESYDRLITFIRKHLNEKFYIENDLRINLRDKIAREICANILIHREYSNPFPAKLIIDNAYIKTENANKPKMIGCINITDYVPYPKNPKIAKFFKEIGLADELGSSVRNVAKYTKIYSGGVPIFKEDDIFKVEVPIANTKSITSGDKSIVSGDKSTQVYNTPTKVSKATILNFLSINDYITTNIAIDLLNLKSKSWVGSILNQMVKDDLLMVEGNNRNRKYKLKN